MGLLMKPPRWSVAPELAAQHAGDELAVEAAVAAVMDGFSFSTLAGPANLEARLRICAADAVRRVREGEGS